MKVKYKPGSIYIGLTDFPFNIDDYVTIVVRYWTSKELEDDIIYYGHITEFDEEMDGFWAVLDDDPDREELFHFGDIEAVNYGDKIPFMGGWTKRRMKHD
jgi:hypothetical protein